MKNLKYIITILVIAVFAVSCETDHDDFNEDRLPVVGLTTAVGGPNAIVPTGGTIDKDINVYVSDISSVERSFSVTINEGVTELGSESYTIGSAVVPANERAGILTVTFSDVNLTSTFQPVRFKVDNSSGEFVSGSEITIQVRRAN
jgi:hypothetical protein